LRRHLQLIVLRSCQLAEQLARMQALLLQVLANGIHGALACSSAVSVFSGGTGGGGADQRWPGGAMGKRPEPGSRAPPPAP
jgi:hypothetical protein